MTESQAENYNFNIDDYNTVLDLKNIFYPDEEPEIEIDYFKHIYISSDNNIINTLLYINRAYKSKTFIEFIMPNKLDFSDNTKFIHNLLIDICNRNYLFLIENKLIDIGSNIKFNINIINDDTKENVEYKTFDLFEMNDIEMKLTEGESNDELEYKEFNLDYNFDKVDYFLIDLFSFKEMLYKNKFDMEKFLYKIMNNNKQIKIILIINENCFIGYDFTSLIEKYREIIELSDIIFCNRNELNYFYRTYNNLRNYSIDLLNRSNINYSKITSSNKSINNTSSNMNNINNNILPNSNRDLIMKKIPYNLVNNNNENSNYDLVVFDNEKHRKNISRISILFENFFSLTIYEQIGTYMEVDTKETFYFKLKEDKQNFFTKEGEKIYYIFIGGFLSRLIHTKSFRVCFYAGYLLLEKIMKNNLKKKIVFKIDDYNVLVPNEKKSFKEKMIKQNEKILEEIKCKEKGFILDCTNLNECKIKIYNPLLDNNCAGYLLKKNIFEHLKHKGFINKNGIVLKDPDKNERAKNNISRKKKNNLKPIYIENDNNIKLPIIQNNYICQTLKGVKENKKIKEVNKGKTYFKTINNFYKLKKLKINGFPVKNSNTFDNSKNKNPKFRTNENSKIEEYMVKTTKTFKIKNKNNSHTKAKILLRNIKLHEPKFDSSKNKKIPKYDIYAKNLFQLYRPDIKLINEFFEVKNKSHKKPKLKKVRSQL